ncbi:MAG: dihydroorotate dehydrogenase-like protein [Sphaerochaeta sp.]|uniref:dihydroorotate dehydrogenase-like protein n=1 Tax=Sphaerochaeta sp. TaxID=1972642 RepID=UPI001DEBF741|nr:dihydroorotate dehydrogenase-like protein [uncultured Sphaerochaeta sp.]MDD3928863.1 dihydroorotate dehydrogenase-like protein [Sphaerochaeta sp.]NCC12082.1 dihydroorotate dehydrogenase-like protein [Spirochaetia bacterium]NCC90039.1 dihydroorotate dehydrogenase-like protein [Spirochaetia bacterium]
MADLSTSYLGLKLKNPLIAGSSPLTASLDNLKRCEDAGMSAVVLKSIFEEQIEMDGESAADLNDAYLTHADAYGFMKSASMERHIDAYLTLLEDAKRTLEIPVIASINCRQSGNWIEYANRFAACGADAIELNHYVVAADVEVEGAAIEKEYLSLVKAARKQIKLPLSLKMGSSFSSLAHMMRKFDELSIDGVVLFNRFYSPDIDINKMTLVPAQMLSSKDEYALSLRWTALMSDEVRYDICASTGIYSGSTVIKQLLAGAKAVQLCSVLLKQGLGSVAKIEEELTEWMDSHAYSRIADFNGKLAQERMSDPAKWERVQYMKSILDAQKG